MATTAHAPQTGSGLRTRAQATRALLDDAAAMVNGVYATALRIVIDAFAARVHREADGFSAQRDWLVSQFDFTAPAAADIAVIAKYARKFTVLAGAALEGYARIDQTAYAVRSLAKTTASALFAKTPFRVPVPSPFDADTLCASPEHLVAEYAAHAPFNDLKRHLGELHAGLAEEAELLDSLGEESLQRFEVQELNEGGMWVVSGLLSATTGALLDKYLKTAVPPPRQDQTDADGVLPPQATRQAEALHQLLASYGSSSDAVTRHGHTATLHLTVDVQTLQGADTGRTPLLEGRPISLARARLLACEGTVIPSVFDYATGEAIELGRAMRLPNTALRRKLELEQPQGCAWSGCDRPVAWLEAHHLQHWASGGKTTAENLILLCRFHHGRIHTQGWSVTKTGPGQALIVHHDHPATETTGAGAAACNDAMSDDSATGTNTHTNAHAHARARACAATAGTTEARSNATGATAKADATGRNATGGNGTDTAAAAAAAAAAVGRATGKSATAHDGDPHDGDGDGDGDGCGCADWRTDTDMDTLFAADAQSFFPTGLYPTEWSEAMRPDLEAVAAQVKEAKAYYAYGGSAAEFDTRGLGRTQGHTDEDEKTTRVLQAPVTNPPPIYGEGPSATDLIPFLLRPPGTRTRRARKQHPGPGTTTRPPARRLHRPAPTPGRRPSPLAPQSNHLIDPRQPAATPSNRESRQAHPAPQATSRRCRPDPGSP